ncbi:hypothetical protein [Pseudomonas sp. PARCl1]|uniref:hypothetical protein n=1 Tax=Pseudomonas sp. PARCl1 TaxID=2853444 RepID=UPI001C75EE15|nr:hypothetical protein [Pseudomonas sp. PARCl1]QXM18698.1 hypothetical protein [Pseudomonas phage PARCL1pr]DAY63718.1 MAG TPA: hypothetical protein [Caudoviricetes sp.]
MTRSAYYEKELGLLVETQAAREFLVQRAEDSTEDRPRWVLLVRRGTKLIPIRSKRENPRTWASLDTLQRFTESVGIPQFTVESR